MKLRTISSFLGIIIVTTLVLALVYQWTLPNINTNQQQAQLAALAEILPANSYNNDLLASKKSVVDKKLFATYKPINIYFARQKNHTTAVVYTTLAPNGYSGPINLIVSVNRHEEIIGVRVLQHNETPGLGDKMELSKSDWIKSFAKRSLANTPQPAWRVRKNGGEFDSWTGATITPQAIVQAVHRVLQYSKLHHEELFKPDHEE